MGARIWELCDGQRTVREIADALADEYDAAPEEILPDAVELIDELSAEGLLASA